MKIISACLLGVNCRFNGKNKFSPKAKHVFDGGEVILICPEMLINLGIPREACEIVGGDGFDVLEGKARVVSKSGKDFTQLYLDAAQKASAMIENLGITKAYLKSGSPTCGAGTIYNGDFTGEKKNGFGVFSALLKNNGIELVEID
ncbi:MAG: DUF523 domain-containing protein [Candidatus Berkelbacteria bacterium]|nr:DUF523 domain-containing protein [Candidatus Berkelbacteria bacterium]